jgi:hypothetical protein
LPAELTLWIDPEEVSFFLTPSLIRQQFNFCSLFLNQVTARFGEHKGSYCILAKFKGGNKENYVNQININELEQKSMERARQAILELMLTRKKKFNKNTFPKVNPTPISSPYANCAQFDMAAVNASANGSTFYGSYYGSSPKYYSSSPPQAGGSQSPVSHHGSTPNHSAASSAQSGLYSPSRMSPYRQNLSNGIFSSMTSKYSARSYTGLSFSSGLMYDNASSYQADRYHWLNKSIVKA